MWRPREYKPSLVILASAVLLLIGGPPERPSSKGDVEEASEAVLAPLRRILAWYQQARVVMQAANLAAGSLFSDADQQTVLRVLQRGFDTARAQAALRKDASGPAASSPQPGGRLADKRERLLAAIRREDEEVIRLRTSLRTAETHDRASLERQLVAATDRLELDRLRLNFVTALGQFEFSLPGAEPDITREIETLQEAMPELRSSGGVSPGAARTVSVSPGGALAGTPALLQHLLALQRSRSSIEALAADTGGLARTIDTELRATEGQMRPVMVHLRQLVENPAATGDTPTDKQEFQTLLERARSLGAVVLPLREQSTLLRRYAGDLQEAVRAVDREAGRAVERLLIELVGVVVAIAAVLVGGLLWRIAAIRYVTDPYRRRLLLTVRNVVVVTAVVLVLVFHFTSELAALVAALGFGAAGIAFALQNVILAVAGYFSMVAPNGIRVGDRVSLQGPFGYVHGEVVEIGFVRMKLHELAGEQLQPTGRTVVFPNSVVFTGSFFKHPSGDATC
jgi:hypothetical protein